jgi:hypothetical protein
METWQAGDPIGTTQNPEKYIKIGNKRPNTDVHSNFGRFGKLYTGTNVEVYLLVA